MFELLCNFAELAEAHSTNLGCKERCTLRGESAEACFSSNCFSHRAANTRAPHEYCIDCDNAPGRAAGGLRQVLIP